MPEPIQPPEEAVELVAKAIFERDDLESYEPWEGGKGIMLSDEDRDAYRADAHRILNLIYADLRERMLSDEAKRAALNAYLNPSGGTDFPNMIACAINAAFDTAMKGENE